MTSKAGDAAELKDQGNAALKSGDLHGAEALYTNAIGLDSSNHMLFSNRSCVRFELSNYSGALEDAKECISLDPAFMKGYFRAISAAEALGQIHEAGRFCQDGLKIDPKSLPFVKKMNAICKKASAEMSDETGRELVAGWEAALSSESAKQEEQVGAAMSLGSAYMQGVYGVIKDEAKSIHYFRRGAELGHLTCMSNLGSLLLGSGVQQDQEEAMQWLVNAAEQGNSIAGQSSLSSAS
jgi:TPR repeat protein